MTECIRFDASEILDDEESLREYLKLALAENDPQEYLWALETVAKARKMIELSRRTGIAREKLYRAMNDGYKINWQDVHKISSAMGFTLPEEFAAISAM